jgi:predicted RNA binding protein YcfA (HicA-like mRNA interferase family)
MPRKIRELVGDLVRAGFVDRGGKGSHRNFEHPKGIRVTLAGKLGDTQSLIKNVKFAKE